MSIIVISRPVTRPFGGMGGAYPIGTWFSNAVVTGDASGGTREMQVDFRRGTLPPNGLAWSIEALTVQDNQLSSKTGFVLLSNADRDPTNQQIRRFGAVISLEVGGGSTRAFLSPADQEFFRKGWYLGRQGLSTVSFSISVIFANVLNAVNAMTIEGYVWDATAQALLGGPRRPVEGLFSR